MSFYPRREFPYPLPPKGVYSLLIALKGYAILNLPIPERRLRSGIYIYTGSALGKGGSSLTGRLKRHLLRKSTRRFWHIDELLAHGRCTLLSAFCAPSHKRMECVVNKRIKEKLGALPISGFGSSDCRSGCGGHLLRSEDEPERVASILLVSYRSLGLDPLLVRVGHL